MSHYTVLAHISVPEQFFTAAQSLEEDTASRLLQASTDDMSSKIKATAQFLRDAQKKRFEAAVDSIVDALLEPYCESTENTEYLEFRDMTQEGRDKYESGGMDCVQMPDGRILPCFDRRFAEQYDLVEGQVYKKNYGSLHHRKRTKKAKKIRVLPEYPLKKLYPAFDIFMEDYFGYSFHEQEGAYGYYSNSNAKWDWYQIGGRWPFRFLVKSEGVLAVSGELSHMFKEAPSDKGPEGYRWVAGARKCDVAWDVMKELFRTSALEQFQQFQEWFNSKTLPKENWDYVITEEGIACWGDLVYRKGESEDDYLKRCGLLEEFQCPFSTFAYVSEDGWEGSGDAGWFGMSYNKKDEIDWNHMVENFIAALPDDAFLVSVDCHI